MDTDPFLEQLESYLSSCVMEQPEWLQKMFRLRSIVWTLGEDGLGVKFKKHIKPEKKAKAISLIADWMQRCPTNELMVLDDKAQVH